MTTDINLQFIRKKLEQTGIAVMYPTNNDVIKLPNDIIMYLKMDDSGQVWFTARKPRYCENNYDQSFPVRLLFYRKGVDFYIELNGMATIAIAGEEESNGKGITPGSLLLKMTPAVVEYIETEPKNLSAGPRKLYDYFTNWLLSKMQANHIRRHSFSKLP